MVVRYGWKESQIKRRVEFWLHFVPFFVGWSTATASLFLKLFNAFGWTCWINSYPAGCTDNVTCERGDNAGIYRWAFFHAELWTCYALTLLSMVLIYHTIKSQEKVMAKYVFRSQTSGEQFRVRSQEMTSISRLNNTTSQTGDEVEQAGTGAVRIDSEEKKSEPKKKHSTIFAMQAAFYVVAFFMTWFIPMLQAIFSVKSDTLYFPLILLASILSSMQGFSNAAIYLRPRWIDFRRRHPMLTRLQILHYALGLRDPREERGDGRSENLSGLAKDAHVSSIKNDGMTSSEPMQLSEPQMAAVSSVLSGSIEESEPEQTRHPQISTDSLNEFQDSGYMF